MPSSRDFSNCTAFPGYILPWSTVLTIFFNFVEISLTSVLRSFYVFFRRILSSLSLSNLSGCSNPKSFVAKEALACILAEPAWSIFSKGENNLHIFELKNDLLKYLSAFSSAFWNEFLESYLLKDLDIFKI